MHITMIGPFEPEAGFNGFYAIAREVRDDPIRDTREAVDFLRGLCGATGRRGRATQASPVGRSGAR